MVNPGVYNITETVPAGWSLTGIAIQEGAPANSSYSLTANSSIIKVDPGEWVNVTFTDTKEGRINIVKDAVPNDPQSFNFKSNNTAQIPGFSLVDNGGVNNRTFHVAPGTYNVSEIVPTGWSLTGIVITDPTSDSTFSVNTNSTKLVVSPGELVNVTFTDQKPLGEVKYDLGDAPDPNYPTLLASNGARHVIDNIWMGATVDDEPNGQPSISADGDDLNPGGGPDDEDGVTFLGAGPPGGPYAMPYTPGQNGAVKITVTGPITGANPAYLHGWIDWNQDGDWNDLGENLFSGYIVNAPGDYTINFPVPADAKTGKTYARFRIDDQNLNSPTGEATNGEVEDYLVDPAVRPPEEPPQQQTQSRPVGGYVMPTNKLAILTPYLALAGLVGIASAIVVARRKRRD
jgi:hypothetical protein